MANRSARESGFSLIETMVVASIVAVVAYFAVDGVTNALRASTHLNDRLIANQVIQERISKMKNSVGFYLPLVSGADQLGIYVGCFNKRGVALASADGKEGEVIVFGKKPGESSGKCKGADLEVQFQPDLADNRLLNAYVIIKQSSTGTFVTDKRSIRLERTL
jgi:prepilin-type N-terminal cleavage/methylation domain-containing protein